MSASSHATRSAVGELSALARELVQLKVDVIANPTLGKVLKGQTVEFKVSVTNHGDGPARNVTIQAKLTPGLRHESGHDRRLRRPRTRRGPSRSCLLSAAIPWNAASPSPWPSRART